MSAANGGRGQFFAIDRRAWAKACDCGTNEATAYLVLACGTGRDNRTTSWSCEAIRKYTGVTWSHGKEAIENLRGTGLIGRTDAHTRQKPKYELLPFEGSRKAAGDESDGFLWLPNAIVTGTPNGEVSPVYRLRSAGDVWALRLFVDLYHAQNLRDDGGISPQVLRLNFDRKKWGESGIYNVWGFKRGDRTLWWTGPFSPHRGRSKIEEDHPVWGSVTLLEQMGLLTFIPHLLENDSPQAEVIHPLGIGGKGEEPIETEIGDTARATAESMCAEWVMQRAEQEDFDAFCPVPRTLPNIQLVGIARLRYRPHTSMTAAWYANLQESGRAAKEKYEELPFYGGTQKKEKFA
jgi:hypothetical protein